MKALVFLFFLLLSAAPADAQAVAPPGPWVLDLRGATSGLPSDTAFYPELDVDTLVPARAFGFEVGAHVYVASLGPARVGIGAAYSRSRGTSERVTASLSTLAPQVSFNFGSSNGWSYLGAGLGLAWIRTTVEQLSGTAEQESGSVRAFNFGGGARWFLAAHVGIGFDVRWHQVASTPGAMLLSAAAGFSIH